MRHEFVSVNRRRRDALCIPGVVLVRSAERRLTRADRVLSYCKAIENARQAKKG